jgi:uncharacterized membrane protein YqaE (UPF0057 family)
MLALLTFACPPLAVWRVEKRGHSTALNVLLTLLLYIPGVIHAWQIVERYRLVRRYDRLWRYLEQQA